MAQGEYWNEKIETMPPAEVREMQEAKLRQQVAYVYENSPFYKRKFDEVGLKPQHIKTLRDLAEAPFTTKDELRESQIRRPILGEHAAVPLQRVVRLHSTSGTTGRPSYIGITRHDQEVWTEVIARVMYSIGIRPGYRMIGAFGMGLFVGGIASYDGINKIGATFISIGTGASERLITCLQDMGGAEFIICTPSYAIYLAEYVRSRGIEPRSLKLENIMCGAEPGGGVPGIRKKISEDWGAIVTEGLGNGDLIACYSGECRERNGNHHLAPDYLMLEIIDPDTGQVLDPEDGVTGELVGTHLDRQCVPLIRFRTRDRVTVYTAPCPCGRTSYRLVCVGRTDDMLIVAGVNVFPSAIKDVVSGFRPRTTGEIQVLLDEPPPRVTPPLKVRVEYGDQAGDMAALKKELERVLRDKLIFAASVELVPPGALPRFEMKAQLVKKLYEVGSKA